LQLLALQTAAERYYFGIRKSLVEFDEVMEVMLILYSLYHGMGLP
jgi:preprotein translocase subunit SecA